MPWLSEKIGAGQTWVPEMRHVGGAMASQYKPEIGEVILARLGEGQTIAEVCAHPEMPSVATLHRWRHVNPEFGSAYQAMRDRNAAHRRMMIRLTRERWLEWARIEAKIGRRRTRTWVCGAASTYERKWARAFCARVAKGQPVYRICAEPGMPSTKAVYGWLRRQPEFVTMYRAAKREAAGRLQLQIQLTADEVLDGVLSPAKFRAIKARVAKIEGRIGRLAPRTYR